MMKKDYLKLFHMKHENVDKLLKKWIIRFLPDNIDFKLIHNLWINCG